MTPAPVTAAVAAIAVTHQQFGCVPEAATVEPDGTFNDVIFNSTNLTAPVLRDNISTPGIVTALGSTTYAYVGANTFRTFTVRAGSLRLDTTRYPNSNPANRTHASRIMASGWGSVTKIVDASDRQSAYTKNGYLYALTPSTGSLARYKVTESTFGAPRISPSGTRTGYAGVRSLALAYRYREGTTAAADVLIATTSAGKLYLITVPVTATFAPRWALLRASTWTFDDIVVGGCQGHYSLIAVRRSTQRAALYRLDTIAGTSSVIRSYGAISGTWASVRSSARWYTGSYPTRW